MISAAYGNRRVAVGLTFLITLGAGLLVVLSDRAQLVNGARPVRHPLSLPMPIAVVLIVLGGWGPGLAAICVAAWECGRLAYASYCDGFAGGESGRSGTSPLYSGQLCSDLIALVLSALTGGPNTCPLVLGAARTSARPDRRPMGRGTWLAGLRTATASTRYRCLLGKYGGRHNMVYMALLASSDPGRWSSE